MWGKIMFKMQFRWSEAGHREKDQRYRKGKLAMAKMSNETEGKHDKKRKL